MMMLTLLAPLPILVIGAKLHISGETSSVVFNQYGPETTTPIEMVAQNGQLNLSGVFVAHDVVTSDGVSVNALARQLSEPASLSGVLQLLRQQNDMIQQLQATVNGLFEHGALQAVGLHGPPVTPRIYLVGGSVLSQPVSSTTSWDPVSDRFSETSIPPTTWYRSGAVSVICNGSLWVIGGSGGFHTWTASDRSDPLRSVLRYPLAGGTWQEVAPLPFSLTSHGAHCLNNAVHVLKVSYVRYSSDNVHLRFDNNRWVSMSTSFTLFEWASPGQVVLNDQLYLVGGRDKRQGASSWNYHTSLTLVNRYNAESDSWVQVASLLKRRGTHNGHGLAVASVGGLIYACGGYSCTGAGCSQVNHNDCETFDPNGGPSGAWANIGNMIAGPRNYLVRFNGTLYMLGGASRIISLDPSTNTWSIASEGHPLWGTGEDTTKASGYAPVAYNG
jgi:hypothetical protein